MERSRFMVINQQELECQDISDYFQDSGYSVISCSRYNEAIEMLKKGRYPLDLLIIDMDTSDRESYDAIEQIRSFSKVPMIVMSRDSRLDSQLYAYSKHIDDYMVKPVPLPLLEAHVEALLRRCSEKGSQVEVVGALTIDYESRKIYLADKQMKVTSKEFDLMEYFIQHKGMILSRDKILDSVWGFDYVGGYRSVDTMVKKLRAKLTKEYPYIRTVYGVGYSFEV